MSRALVKRTKATCFNNGDRCQFQSVTVTNDHVATAIFVSPAAAYDIRASVKHFPSLTNALCKTTNTCLYLKQFQWSHVDKDKAFMKGMFTFNASHAKNAS